MGLFRKKQNISNKETEILVGSDPLLLALFNSEVISKEQALSIPAVSSAIDIIAGKISTIPIKYYKEKDNDGKKAVVEVKDSRCDLLNDDTGDTLSGVQFKKALVIDYLLDKGGYAFIKRIGNNTKSLHYVNAEQVSISKVVDPIFKKYTILVNGKTYKDYEFIKILRNTKDGAKGESIRNEISKALQTAYQNLLMQYQSAKKGGKKRGFLKTERALSKEVLDDLKKKWEQLYSNDDLNSIVLPQGAEFQESNDSTFEQRVNETRKQLNDEIKDIFHIGLNEKETFENAILPILAEIECSINRDLRLEKEKTTGFFFAFDTKDLIKGDIKTRFEAYQIGVKSGVITPNEARFFENMDEIDGLDIINFGLGSAIYDIKTKSFYIPNTGENTTLADSKNNEKGDEEAENET